jgi:murein DD-endopeptidase MepM/ murein hydrolase activator NlpD
MPLRVFPVAATGRPTFSDDFGKPRSGGRSHLGNDIFAPEGTPVLAVDDGRVELERPLTELGGITAFLRGQDGTGYYYAHLSAIEGKSRKVGAGEVIGYVGKTGNAAHTSPHLHFEMTPGGGSPVDPFDSLRAVFPSGAPSSPSSPASPPVAPAGARAGAGAGAFLILLALLAALDNR